MTVLDVPHTLTTTPTLLTGLLLAAALVADAWWTFRAWRKT